MGTATPVCEALDKIADISVPGSKDHLKVQGEILEGLVARIVSHQSSDQMKEVLRSLSQAPLHGVDSDLGPSLREICAANRSDEKQKLKHFLKMSDLQCVQTTLIGLETVVLMLSLKTLINRLSLTFWKHILQTMQLRNCRRCFV